MKSRRISVRAKGGEYSVIISLHLERELLDAVRKQGKRRIAVITDTTVAPLYGASVARVLRKTGQKVDIFSVRSGERNKDQDTVTELQYALLKKKFGRDTLVVALGGGVVGDVAGFVAATFLRGVPYIQMPTTLLAMVDSSIGGKVGIDTPFGKNTVGAFWQPKVVISDLRFLKALPKRQLISGLLEAVKSFFTSDAQMLADAKKLNLDDPLRTADILQRIVFASVSQKADVIARDELELNERKILNFGHTVGHAIELLSGYKMPHGFAVGYGILAETKIAETLGILSAKDCLAVAEYLAQFGIIPAGIKKFSIPAIIKATKSDKKTLGGKTYYVLLSSVGSVDTKGGQYAHSVEDAVVIKALKALR